jgi:hypothetical protein
MPLTSIPSKLGRGYDGGMNWPTPQMALGVAIIAALICGGWMWSSHQAMALAAPITIAVTVAVYLFIRRYGREPNA